jgi:uncharacterized iron-regulated membrane protein
MSYWSRKLHRWVALLFALPLVVVLVTGLILSFEPWLVTSAVRPGSLKPERVAELLAKHDAKGQARGIVHRAYDGTLTFGSGRGGGTVVDISSGEALPGPSRMANLLGTSRRMHETLLIDAGWLVVASTIAMLALTVLGLGMGWPRWSNNLSGWHKTTAWGLLPLVVLSPLTGLFIAWGITFTPPRAPASAAEKAAPLRLAEAVQIVARSHDLSGLVWLRPQGGAVMARIVEGGEYKVYRVSREGTAPTPRNWPRLWHEGNFAGAWSALLNVVTSIALIGLLVTGTMIWAKRTMRRARQRSGRAIERPA